MAYRGLSRPEVGLALGFLWLAALHKPHPSATQDAKTPGHQDCYRRPEGGRSTKLLLESHATPTFGRGSADCAGGGGKAGLGQSLRIE